MFCFGKPSLLPLYTASSSTPHWMPPNFHVSSRREFGICWEVKCVSLSSLSALSMWLLTSSGALHATYLCIATPHEAGILRSKKRGNKAVNHLQLPSVNKQCKWDRIHHLLLETQRLSALSHPTNQDTVRAQNGTGRIGMALFNSLTPSLHRSVSWLPPMVGVSNGS